MKMVCRAAFAAAVGVTCGRADCGSSVDAVWLGAAARDPATDNAEAR